MSYRALAYILPRIDSKIKPTLCYNEPTRNPIVNYVLNNHVLSTVLLVGFAFLLFEIRTILLAIFMAYIIMASLYPFIKFLTKNRTPKIIALIITYSIVLAFIVLLVVPVLPFFIEQLQSLFKAIPGYVDKSSAALGIEITKSQLNALIVPTFNTVSSNALEITGRIFGGLFSILTVFILSFYLLLSRNRFEKIVPELFPVNSRTKIKETMMLVEEKLGAWLRGQILLSLVIGVISWIALTILGIPYALPLAILAGVLEIIPTLGPIISAIPAAIVAFSISPLTALLVILVYTGIQVAENNILVPKIMEKAVGLNPVLIIVAILIGGNLLGLLGALLSIPFVSAIIVIIRALK